MSAVESDTITYLSGFAWRQDVASLRAELAEASARRRHQDETLRQRERELTALKGALKEEVECHDREMEMLREQYGLDMNNLRKTMEQLTQVRRRHCSTPESAERNSGFGLGSPKRIPPFVIAAGKLFIILPAADFGVRVAPAISRTCEAKFEGSIGGDVSRGKKKHSRGGKSSRLTRLTVALLVLIRVRFYMRCRKPTSARGRKIKLGLRFQIRTISMCHVLVKQRVAHDPNL